MNEFVLGAGAMASVVVAARFGRYWRDTGDHLFWRFALAFLIIGLSQPVAGVHSETGEAWSPSCLVTFAAYLLILWAIVEKNANGFHRRPRP